MTLNPTAFGLILRKSFERIRIVNLPDRTDRAREVTAQFARLGLGIDGKQIALHPANRFVDAQGFRTAGARGCFTSHLAILRDAERDSVSTLLLLEDDFDFIRAIETAGPLVLEALNQTNWGLFYGGYRRFGVGGHMPTPLFPIAADEAIGTSHCIAVRGGVIGELRAYLDAMLGRAPGSAEGGPMDVDGAYSWFRRAHPQHQTWLANPEIGVQRPSRTDVHPPHPLDRHPFTRPVANGLRRLRRLWR